MTDDDITLGEIRRNLIELKGDVASLRVDVRDRYHNLTTQIQSNLGPVAVLSVKVENTEKDLNEVGNRMRECEKAVSDMNLRAAYFGGGVAAAITIVVKLLDLWK